MQNRIATLKTREQNLIDAIVEKRIKQEVFDSQMAIGGTELAAAQFQLDEQLIREEELESLLDFADWLLGRIAGIWNSASPQKEAHFPGGISVQKGGIRNHSSIAVLGIGAAPFLA